MAQIPGTRINSSIVPNDSGDIYSTHQAQYGKGGWRTVADTTERNAITTQRREEGMVVWVSDLSAAYQLIGGVDNANWTTLNLSPNLSGYALIQDVENLDLDLQSQITSIETSASILNDYVLGHQEALSVITSVSGALIGSVVHISGNEDIYDHKNFKTSITFGQNHLLTDQAHFNVQEFTNGWNGLVSYNTTNITGGRNVGVCPSISGHAFHITCDDRGYIYITNKLSDLLMRLDVIGGNVKTYTMPVTGYETNTMCYCPTNKSMYIPHDYNRDTTISNGVIRQFNVETEQFVGSVTLPLSSSNAGDNLRGITFCPVNGLLYTVFDSLIGSGTPEPYVFAINPVTNTVVAKIGPLANRPWSVTYIPSIEKLYIGHIVSQNIEIIDPYTNTITNTITGSDSAFNQHMVFCPKNGLIYSVTSNMFADRRINIIDPKTSQIVDLIIPPSSGVKTIQTIFWNPRTEKLYGLAYPQGSSSPAGIVIINPLTNKIEKQLPFTTDNDNCRWAAYNYNTGLLYVINYHVLSANSDVLALS